MSATLAEVQAPLKLVTGSARLKEAWVLVRLVVLDWLVHPRDGRAQRAPGWRSRLYTAAGHLWYVQNQVGKQVLKVGECGLGPSGDHTGKENKMKGQDPKLRSCTEVQRARQNCKQDAG